MECDWADLQFELEARVPSVSRLRRGVVCMFLDLVRHDVQGGESGSRSRGVKALMRMRLVAWQQGSTLGA